MVNYGINLWLWCLKVPLVLHQVEDKVSEEYRELNYNDQE